MLLFWGRDILFEKNLLNFSGLYITLTGGNRMNIILSTDHKNMRHALRVQLLLHFECRKYRVVINVEPLQTGFQSAAADLVHNQRKLWRVCLCSLNFTSPPPGGGFNFWEKKLKNFWKSNTLSSNIKEI